MTDKTVPFSKDDAQRIIETYPTPFHIYDEKAIRENARELLGAFSWCQGFKQYFAVKALPNPYILKILESEGMGADCSSMPELLLAEKSGITGENIMFTSNDTPASEYCEAARVGAVINLDDISHISYLADNCSLPELVSFRYNPGNLRQGNAIIGNPQEAKYGFTREQLFAGYGMLRDMGVRRFGLHAMIASNELNPHYFVETAVMLFELVAEISAKAGIRFEFVNIGGGIGIPYRPEQTKVDLTVISRGIQEAYKSIIETNGLAPLKIYMECGRMVTGPFGYLVTKVLHRKNTYKNYIGVDACMANLMRPGMYGAYHHITVLGKESASAEHTYDVTGSLCENNDKFAIDRLLPEIDIDDILVIHDTGAHGHAMGFNYNGKLRSAELLLRADGSVIQIRRAETAGDYFATLDLNGLSTFR